MSDAWPKRITLLRHYGEYELDAINEGHDLDDGPTQTRTYVLAESVQAVAEQLLEQARKARVEAHHQHDIDRASYCNGQAMAWENAADQLSGT